MNRINFIIRLSLSILILAACQPVSSRIPATFTSPRPWRYADLRALDAADASANAWRDLLALYVRQEGDSIQIRLDLLDLNDQNNYDLYLAIDSNPGGQTNLPLHASTNLAWDIWIAIPANQASQALDANLQPLIDPMLRVFRDPSLDTVTISLSRRVFKQPGVPFKIQVFTTAPGQLTPEDSLGPVSSDALPPARVPTLIAFWNTFQAATPAQALRAWDGAHSGPDRARHGLRHLLAAVMAHQIPVFLLDLKTPGALAALDYLGALPVIQDGNQRGLIQLPDVVFVSQPASVDNPSGNAFKIPDWVIVQASNDSRQAGVSFGVRASRLLYAPDKPKALLSRYDAIITPVSVQQPTSIITWQGRRMISIPNLPGSGSSESTLSEPQATRAGLSVVYRRLLIDAALNSSSSSSSSSSLRTERTERTAMSGQEVVFLGGDFTQSSWGEPGAVAQTLAWLAAHPWIEPLDENSLLSLSPSGENNQGEATLTPSPSSVQQTSLFTSQGDLIPSGLNAQQMQDEVLAALQNAPDNAARAAAWQAYLALLADSAAPLELRVGYFAPIGHLLAAADWAAAPSSRMDCSADLDWDGLPECVLASETFFSVLETDGARISIAFIDDKLSDDGERLHQIIAPSSQVVIGLSDPMDWDLQRGEAGDPALIPGAFVDSFATWQPYSPVVTPEAMTFVNSDGLRRKVFQLTDNTLRVDYLGFEAEPFSAIHINLGLDLASSNAPGWCDQFISEPGAQSWAWGSHPSIVIRTSGTLSGQTFLDSSSVIGKPEDPNYSYPAGHYLPFPLARIDVSAQGDVWVTLTIQPTP